MAQQAAKLKQAVRIDSTGRVVNDDRVVSVRKNRNEDVLWIAEGNGGPWKVKFDKDTTSPFSEDEYDVAQGATKGSTGGPVKGTEKNTYRYNVKDASGRVTDDPDIEIEP